MKSKSIEKSIKLFIEQFKVSGVGLIQLYKKGSEPNDIKCHIFDNVFDSVSNALKEDYMLTVVFDAGAEMQIATLHGDEYASLEDVSVDIINSAVILSPSDTGFMSVNTPLIAGEGMNNRIEVLLTNKDNCGKDPDMLMTVFNNPKEIITLNIH